MFNLNYFNQTTSSCKRYLQRFSSRFVSSTTYAVFTPLTQRLYTVISFGLNQLLNVGFGRLVTISVTTLTSFGYVNTAALKSATVSAHACVAVFLMPLLLLDTAFSTFLGSSSRTGQILEPLSRLLSVAMRSIVRTTCGTYLDIRISTDQEVLLRFIDDMIARIES